MPDSFIPYGPDPASPGRRDATVKRTETRDGVTADFHRSEIILTDRKIRTYRGIGATFRIPGNASLAQPLWSIENTTGSSVVVAISRLMVTVGQSAANTTHPPWLYLFRTTTMPTGGTVVTKAHPDGRSAEVSSGNVVIRQGGSADGSSTPAIVAPFVAPRLSSMHGAQLYTVVGQGTPLRNDMLAGIADDHMETGELRLGPGQAFVLHVTTAAAADNIATRSFIIDYAWSEFTEY